MTRLTRRCALTVTASLVACTPQLDQEDVGVDKSSLVNATIDVAGQFPYVASVSRAGVEACTGTLVGSRHVLTAAHCLCTSANVDDKNFASACQSQQEVTISFKKGPLGRSNSRQGTACVHGAYRSTESSAHDVVFRRADLAVVTLNDSAPTWATPVTLGGTAPLQLRQRLTMVGYGYSMCTTDLGNGVRRFGTGRISTIDLDNFPDLFAIYKETFDFTGSVVRPGDSGGPALRPGVGQPVVEGVATSSACHSGPLLLPWLASGVSYYTRLDSRDDAITHQTYRQWISNWIDGTVAEICGNGFDDDCNGSGDCADATCADQAPCCGHEGDDCCQHTSCVDDSLICDAASQKCVARPVLESCNFADDNGDGRVDEGLDWSASDWSTVLTTTNYAVYPRAIALRDGRIAVSGVDSWGGGFDRGLLVVLSATGQPVAPPVWTSIRNSGGELNSVTENPNGEIAALYSSTDYSGCVAGCPVHLTRIRTSDLGLQNTSTVGYPFRSSRAFDIAWAPHNYVTLVRDSDTITHLSWLDQTAGNVLLDRALPGAGTDAGSLAASVNRMAWIRSRAGTPNVLEVGVFTADGAAEALAPTTIASSTSIVVGFRSATWLNEGLVVTWAQKNEEGMRLPMAAIVDADGTVSTGPAPIGPEGFYVNDIAAVDSGGVVVLLVDDGGSLILQRLGATLAPIVNPNGALQFPSLTSYSTMAKTASGLALVHGYTDAMPRSFRVAHVGCK